MLSVDTTSNDTMLINFLKIMDLMYDVNHNCMGKKLIEGWEEAIEDYQHAIIEFFRPGRTRMITHVHVLHHSRAIMQKYGLGLRKSLV